MLHTIVNEYDVFYTACECTAVKRSSNPYDYIRSGYYIDNAALFGGYNNVSFNCNFSSLRTSNKLPVSDIGVRSQRNIP